MPMNLGLGLGLSRRIGGGGFSAIATGFSATRDEGTTGDLFVAKTGSDTNPGTFAQPKLTINGALAAATAGQEIKVRAGTYRELVDLSGKGGSSGNRTTISRYGTEEVIISAANPQNGFVPCVIADATDVGANWAQMFKVTLPLTHFPGNDPRAAHPYEAGVRLTPAISWLPNPQFPGNEQATQQWHTADATVVTNNKLEYDGGTAPFSPGQTVTGATSGATGVVSAVTGTTAVGVLTFSSTSGNFQNNEVITSSGGAAVANGTLFREITGYQDASVTSLFTTAQIENADVLFHCAPNVNRRTKVLSFTGGTINLTDTTGVYETNQYRDLYALINVLPAMKRGQWGFKIVGSDAILYIWPNNPATINTAIEITRRGECVEAATVSHVEIRGLILERAASAGAATDGLYAYNAGGITRRANHVIENCLIRETYRARRDYAPIWLGLIDDWRIERVTILNPYGQFGIFCLGSDWNTSGMALRGRLFNSVVDGAENSPIRLFGQSECLVAFCRAYRSGLAAHSNKSNYYSDCHRVTFWGCDFRGASGYLTWQRAGAIAIGFCDVPVSYGGSDGRAIVDQNSGSAGAQSPATEQGIDGTSYIINNITEPYVEAIAATNSLTLSEVAETQVRYGGKNNILHGASTVNQTLLVTNGWRNNLLTSGSPLAASAGTDTTAAVADVYVDQARGDVSIRATSPTRSAATASIASEVAILQGWYPDAATVFTRDLVGQTFNPNTPPMGPYVQPNNAPALPGIWINRPAITGILVSGQTVSVDDGYLIGFPWPSRTFQWVVSDDLDQWSNIPGATSATYTVQAGDVGRYLGCRVTAGGASVISASPSLVLATYPIATPTQLAYLEQTSGSATSKNLETPAFSTNGRPILVVASQRSSSNADATLTVTLGAASRAFGTGTTVPFVFRGRSTSNESQVLILLAPGTATNQTIQVQSSLTTFGTQVAVFEVEGLTGTGATGSGGVSVVSSITSALTTLNPNSAVLHIFNRFSGDIVADPVTLSGADLLLNDNTGGNSVSADLAITIGFELASVPGAYGATATWTTNRTARWTAIELRS